MLGVRTPSALPTRCGKLFPGPRPWGGKHRAFATVARPDQRGRRRRGCVRGIVCMAFWGRMFSSSGDREEGNRDKGSASSSSSSSLRRDALLNFVEHLSPVTHRISESTVPKTSVVAIRQTVGNLIGTLPAEYFEITISSREENLMQLMYSVLMTGYMFCNAQHRLELARRLETASPRRLRRASSADWRVNSTGTMTDSKDETNALEDTCGDEQTNGTPPKGFLPDVRKRNDRDMTNGDDDTEDDEYIGEDVGVYAAGTQKVGIQGDVLRWHLEHGVQRLSAAEYIEQLELEVAALRRELVKHTEGLEDIDDDEGSSDAEDGSVSVFGSSGTSTDDALARLAFYTRTQSHLPVRGNEIPKSYRVEEDPSSVFDEELDSELLGFLKTLSPEQVAELTECASADVMESMNALVERMVGSNDDGLWKGSNKAQCTSSELGEILFWLMGVGHQLRDMEIRLSLSTSLQTIPSSFGDDGIDEYPNTDSLPRLPPGK